MNTGTIHKCCILVLLLCFAFSPRSTAAEAQKYWWQAELRFTVTGSYSYRHTGMSEQKGFKGMYSFSAVVLGSMSEDDQDYIFLQAYQDIPKISWKETVFDNTTRSESDLSKSINLDPTLNYVFTDKGLLVFDFDFQPLPVPAKSKVFSHRVRKLRLPKSAGDHSVKENSQYNAGIIEGSNKRVVPQKDIYSNKQVSRTFRWKWERKDDSVTPVLETGQTINREWQNTHRVEVTLKIIRLIKK